MIIFPIVLSDSPLFIRGGHIITLRYSHKLLSADESRKQPLSFKIALRCDNVDSNDDESQDSEDRNVERTNVSGSFSALERSTNECFARGKIIINSAACEIYFKKEKEQVRRDFVF